jgi:catechol 2,3-dioxygenase-like lactoylglutathione lyase family enzyme
MPTASLSIDHTHLISPDPIATAQWYVDRLGGTIVRSVEMAGAPQVYIAFGGGAMVIVRGQRTGEKATGKPALNWGIDHFGMRVQGDFDGLCSELKAQGVKFTMEPTDINPSTRIAFIEAPDGVSVELLERK